MDTVRLTWGLSFFLDLYQLWPAGEECIPHVGFLLICGKEIPMAKLTWASLLLSLLELSLLLGHSQSLEPSLWWPYLPYG